MCWSLEVSLFTGILCYSTVIILLFRRTHKRELWNAFWLTVLGTMQWIDAGLWYIYNTDKEYFNSCQYWNKMITWTGLVTICFEPISNLLGSFYANNIFYKKLLFIYLIIFAVLTRLANVTNLNGCVRGTFTSCTQLTESGHMLYSFGTDINGTHKCWRKYYIVGEYQDEIPLIFRIAFLIGIILPYSFSNPLMPGLINMLIITGTWIIGYFSDAHASVWCLAASLQSIYFLLDPYIFKEMKIDTLPPDYNILKKKLSEQDRNKLFKKLKKESNKLLQNRFNIKKVPANLDVIVIGSGISGLTTAALLAKTGKKVLVLEQHYRAGGCTHVFDEFGDSEFDSGIHYVGTINRVKLLLSFVTTKFVEWYKMGSNNNGIYDVIDLDGNLSNNKFNNETLIKYRAGKGNIEQELINKFPNDKNDIERYFKFLDNIGGKITYIYILSKIFPNSFLFNENNWFYKKFIKNNWKYALMTADQVLSNYFNNEKIKSILGGGQLIDWCLIPEHVSWWVCSAMTNYYENGGYYPISGANCIPESIIPIILQNGGNVLCRAKVDKILINKKTNLCYGVSIDKIGYEIYAKQVISSVGALTLNNELLYKPYSITFNENILPSSLGHITCFITFDGNSNELDLPDYNIHSYCNLIDYQYNVNNVQKMYYKDPFKYGNDALITLTFPSAKDPLYDKKYPNKSNCLLLMEAQYHGWFDNGDNGNFGNRSQKYKDFKKKFEQIFKQRLFYYCPKTKGKIISMDIGTPLTSEHFLNTYKGGSYGLAWTTDRMKHKYTKEMNLHAVTKIKNLYLTGESTVFGGFAGALASAYVTIGKMIGWWPLAKLLLSTKRVNQ